MKHHYDDYDQADTAAEVTAHFLDRQTFVIEAFDDNDNDAGNFYLVDLDGYVATLAEDMAYPDRPLFTLHAEYGPAPKLNTLHMEETAA